MVKKLLYIATILFVICHTTFCDGLPLGIRLGSIFLWGPDVYAIDNRYVTASPDTVFFHSFGTYDSISLTSAPLIGVQLMFQIPFGKHLYFEAGPAGQWKESRLTLFFADPKPDGFNRTIIKYNYWSADIEIGLYHRDDGKKIATHWGGFVCSGISGWGSNVDYYTKDGKPGNNDGFLGINGYTPLGLNGDKKTNYADGLEYGFGIRAGADYHITPHFAFTLEGCIRISRSFVTFSPDVHLWEDTEEYQDLHTEWLLGRQIGNDATFSVVPSMFGVSAGVRWEFMPLVF